MGHILHAGSGSGADNVLVKQISDNIDTTTREQNMPTISLAKGTKIHIELYVGNYDATSSTNVKGIVRIISGGSIHEELVKYVTRPVKTNKVTIFNQDITLSRAGNVALYWESGDSQRYRYYYITKK